MAGENIPFALPHGYLVTQIGNANAQLGWVERLFVGIDQEELQCAQLGMSGTDQMIKFS